MVIRSLLSKVTVDDRPFSSLEDISYKLYSEPAMKALGFHYDRKNIGELVEESAQFLKEELRKDLENLVAQRIIKSAMKGVASRT